MNETQTPDNSPPTDDLQALLAPAYPNMVTSTLVLDHCHGHKEPPPPEDPGDPGEPGEPGHARVVREFGRRCVLKAGLGVRDYAAFFVGAEGAVLRNFMMTWNRCLFSTFQPATSAGRAETPSVNRALMKRYYAIERAKDAGVVGILVGTLGVADYLAIITQLKETVRRAGKKSYMFAMGKLNVAKLANFQEIDVFVLIACPENSLLEHGDFYKPVVTPFEMEVACNRGREWSEDYVTDFRDLLPGLLGLFIIIIHYYYSLLTYCGGVAPGNVIVYTFVLLSCLILFVVSLAFTLASILVFLSPTFYCIVFYPVFSTAAVLQ